MGQQTVKAYQKKTRGTQFAALSFNDTTVSVLNEELQTIQKYASSYIQYAEYFITRDNMIVVFLAEKFAIIDFDSERAFTVDRSPICSTVDNLDTLGKSWILLAWEKQIDIYHIKDDQAVLTRTFSFEDYLDVNVVNEDQFIVALYNSSLISIYDKNSENSIQTIDLQTHVNYSNMVFHFIGSKYYTETGKQLYVFDIKTKHVEVLNAKDARTMVCGHYLVVYDENVIAVYDSRHNFCVHHLSFPFSALEPLPEDRIIAINYGMPVQYGGQLVSHLETLSVRSIYTGVILQNVTYPNNLYGFQVIRLGNDFKAISWSTNFFGYSTEYYYDSKTNRVESCEYHGFLNLPKALSKEDWRQSKFVTNLSSSIAFVDTLLLLQ